MVATIFSFERSACKFLEFQGCVMDYEYDIRRQLMK